MQEQTLSLILRARNVMLQYVGYLKQYVFLLLINFIAIIYRQNLYMFKNYYFTKFFLKLRAVVCVCLCSERRETS